MGAKVGAKSGANLGAKLGARVGTKLGAQVGRAAMSVCWSIYLASMRIIDGSSFGGDPVK